MCLLSQESLGRQQWLNSYEKQHGSSAVFGVNKFSDLTQQEFKGSSISLVPTVSPDSLN